MTTEEQIHQIIVEHLGCNSPLRSDDEFTDLGADSLDMLELAMVFEETFNIDVPDADLETLTTVGAAVRYVQERV